MTSEQIRLELDTTQGQSAAKSWEKAILASLTALEKLDTRTNTLEQHVLKSARAQEYMAQELRRATAAIGHTNAAVIGLARSFEQANATGAKAGQSAKKLGEETEAAGRRMRRAGRDALSFDDATRRIQSGVRRLSVLLGAGLGFQAAVRGVRDFELEMARVGAVTNASGRDFAALRAQALRLGETTEFTSTQAAQGELMLARAGFTARESIAALPATLNLATTAQIGLGESAEFVSNTIRQFAKRAEDAGKVADVYTEITNRSNTNVRELAEAYRYSGSLAGAYGRSLAETGAALGVLADRGIKASSAGTNLRGVMVALQRPTVEMQRAVRAAGADITKLDPASNNLVTVFGELKKAIDGGASAAELFGRRNVGAAIILANSTDRMRELIAATNAGTGASDKFASTVRDTLAGSMNTFVSTVEAAALAAGDNGLLKALRGVVDFGTETVRKLAGLSLEAERFGAATDLARIAVELFLTRLAVRSIETFVGYIAAGAPAMLRFGAATKGAAAATTALGVASRANPIGAIVTAAAAGGLALRTYAEHLDRVRQGTLKLSSASDRLDKSIGDIQARIRGLGGGLQVAGPYGDQASVDRLKEAQRSLSDIAETVDAMRSEKDVLRFTSGDDFGAELKRRIDTAAAADEALRRLQARSAAASRGEGRGLAGDFQNSGLEGIIAQAEGRLRDAQTRARDLQKRNIEVGGTRFVATEVVEDLAKSFGLTEKFNEAVERSRKLIGDPTRVAIGDAADLIGKAMLRAKDATAEAEEALRKFGQAGRDLTAQSLTAEFSVSIDEDLKVQSRRRDLLAQVQAGTVSLADAQHTLNDEQAVARVVGAARAKFEEQLVTFDKDSEKAIRDKAQALVDATRAAELWEQRLQQAVRTETAISSDATDFVRALEERARNLAKFNDAVESNADVLARLQESILPTEAGYADLERRALSAADAIRSLAFARDQQQAREKQFQDAARLEEERARIVRGSELERIALRSTAEEFERIALAEDLRQRGFDEDFARRMDAYQLETQALRRLRATTDDLAGSFSDAIRSVVYDGATGSEAVASFLSSLSSRTLERSLGAIEEQLSAGLTSLFSQGASSQSGGLDFGVTPGDQLIVQSVNAVERAVGMLGTRLAGSAGIGGAAVGGVALGASVSRAGSVGEPGVQGPPVPSAQFSGQVFDWGSFGSNVASGALAFAMSLALASRNRQSEAPPDDEFAALNPTRSGTVVYHDNRRITVQESRQPRRLLKTIRMADEDSRSRFGSR